MDRILMRGMEFFGYHGLLEEEREQGQVFILDLELVLDLSAAGRSDNLEDTVDYAALYQRVRNVVEEERYFLLEALAQRVATVALGEGKVERVRVRVRKPAAPLPGRFRYMGVEVERGRV